MKEVLMLVLSFLIIPSTASESRKYYISQWTLSGLYYDPEMFIYKDFGFILTERTVHISFYHLKEVGGVL